MLEAQIDVDDQPNAL